MARIRSHTFDYYAMLICRFMAEQPTSQSIFFCPCLQKKKILIKHLIVKDTLMFHDLHSQAAPRKFIQFMNNHTLFGQSWMSTRS